MKKSAGQSTTSRLIKVRRILGASAIAAAAAALSSCANGVVSDANMNATWEGARPHPMTASATPTVTRIGSQPLLPPVPEESDNLPPVKMSSLD